MKTQVLTISAIMEVNSLADSPHLHEGESSMLQQTPSSTCQEGIAYILPGGSTDQASSCQEKRNEKCILSRQRETPSQTGSPYRRLTPRLRFKFRESTADIAVLRQLWIPDECHLGTRFLFLKFCWSKLLVAAAAGDLMLGERKHHE